MTRERTAGKRFLTALGISLAVHMAGIVILGMWSLKKPDIQEQPPPLTVFLEPEPAPQPVVEKPEKLPAVKEKEPPSGKITLPKQQRPSQPERKPSGGAGKISVSPPSGQKSVQPVTVPPVQGPETTMKITEQSTEPLTVEKPKPLPKPKGSRIIYGNTPASEEPSEKKPLPSEPSQSVVPTADINALASLLQKSPAPSTEVSSAASPTDETGPPVVSLPDAVTLTLGDSNVPRKPVSKLPLSIPDEMLRKIGHDSFLTAAFTLTPDGYIMDPKIVDSQVGPQIEARVLEALRKWEFNRGSSSDGNVHGQITIRFKVK